MERQFAISGSERRNKKKELSKLKSFVNNFWRCEDVDRAYGGGLSDSECNRILSEAKLKIDELENELSVPYISIVRDSKINNLLND